jgi:hypothetical protein
VNEIVLGAAPQRVRIVSASEHIPPDATVGSIIAVVALDEIAALAGADQIVAGPGVDEVVSVERTDLVRRRAREWSLPGVPTMTAAIPTQDHEGRDRRAGQHFSLRLHVSPFAVGC